MSKSKNDLALLVDKITKRTGWSQKEIADKLPCQRTWLNRNINAKQPSRILLEKMRAKFGRYLNEEVELQGPVEKFLSSIEERLLRLEAIAIVFELEIVARKAKTSDDFPGELSALREKISKETDKLFDALKQKRK